MFSIRARVWVASGALLLAGIVAVPATTVMASATDCNPNPLTTVDECTSVKGTGLYVDSIGGQTFSNVPYNVDAVHIEIYGPHGHIKNCPAFNLGPFGASPVCLWVNPTPHVHVTAGDYCSRAWEYLGGTNYADLSNECVNVHS